MIAHGLVGNKLSEGAEDLIARILNAGERQIIFLLGSALTMQSDPGHSGMPDVKGIALRLEAALAGKGGSDFDDAVARAKSSGTTKDFGVAYRKGFDAMLRRGGGQDAVDRIIREAVLEAHNPLDEEQRDRVLRSRHVDHEKSCRALLNAPDGWRPLRPSVAALGEILHQDSTRLVLTTNFDPLIEVAVKHAGGSVRRTILTQDGDFGQHDGDGTHVVYVHGYWFGADTLHTDRLLKRERSQLTATLRRWIEPALLVVLGYGGWDDVLMHSLQTLAADGAARPDIVWGFYGVEDLDVMHKLEAAGGRVQPYEHVDMHTLLPKLRDQLSAPRSRRSGASLQPDWLEPPYQALPASELTIPGFRLLRAENGVVPMSGREAMFAEFATWCEEPGLAIRLVTAPGGSGKTRLLRELCKRRQEQGWTTGLLRRGMNFDAVVAMAHDGRPMLLAIDYAETWGAELVQLLTALALHRESGGPVRIVLAARADSEWWRELPCSIPELGAILGRPEVVQRLAPVADVVRAWSDAVDAFSQLRGTAARLVTTPSTEVLRKWTNESVLVLHVAALLAVEGDPPAFDAGVGALFDELLRRELIRYWRPEAKRLVGNSVPNLDAVLRSVACIATLVGPMVSREDARAVLARTSGLGGQPEAVLDGLAAVFVGLYPGIAGEQSALPPVQPDRIGERLVAMQLVAVPSLCDVPFSGSDPALTERALRVLGRAAGGHPELVSRLEALAKAHQSRWLRAWIAVAPEEAWAPTLAVRMEAALEQLATLSPDEADVLVQPLPLGSLALRGVAALLAIRAADGVLMAGPWGSASEDELRQRAERWRQKGLRLREMGRRTEALTSTEQAFLQYLELTTHKPEIYLPHFASCLTDLGVMQSDVGQAVEALESSVNSVDVYRKMVAQSGAIHLPDLAKSLNNLGLRQMAPEHRDPAAAHKSTTEAVEIFRQLTEHDVTFISDLAASLTNLSRSQSSLGWREAALTSTGEAVVRYRDLAKIQPDRFLPDLAGSLSNLGIALNIMGERERALKAASESVARWRTLAKNRPEAFLSKLAGSLQCLAMIQLDAALRDDARTSAAEAVALFRGLVEHTPDVFQASLEKSLRILDQASGSDER